MAMADISFLYFFFFFFFFPVCSQSQNTSFIFHGFNGSDVATNISFDGASMITPDGALMLTNRTKQAIGHAFYNKPINTTSSFSTRFVFQIVSPDAGGGYGLAFVLAPSPQLQNTEAGHYLGIFNSSSDGEPSNRIFLVEFDTVNGFRQDEDNQGNHVGISLNSMDTNASKPASYAVNNTENNEDILMGSGAPIQAWIEYDAEVEVVNVTIAPLGMPKPLKHLIDLRVNLTHHLGEESYVGFSAATGEVSSYHYLLGWSFSSNGEAQELDRSRLPSPPRRVEPPRSSFRIRHGVIVALISSLCVVTVLLLGLLVFVLVYRMCTDAEILEDWEIDCPRRFQYKDLHIATKGFKHSELIGTGGFGGVYRGVLPTTRNEVAVKRITRNSLQGIREFVAEIESLGRLRHKNLVNLQGWCKRKNDLLIVYDYIPNGSLDTLLFKPKTGFVLDWNNRFNIVKGIAEGLLYLHEEWEKIVIHRDVKPSNVLIDADMNGRLGDFGLARLFQHGELSHTTNVVGTVGYIAPELARNGTASARSDVYAYGILLLEVAAGRRPTDSGNFLLVDWVMEHQQLGRILDVVDPKLGNYNVEQMELVLQLGLICCHSKPEFRPTMRQVLRYLNEDEMLPSVDDLDSVDTKGKHEMKSRPSKSGSTNTLSAPYHSYASEGISHNSVYNGR